MIIEMLLSSLIYCSKPEIINKAATPWNSTDQEHLTYASKRCSQIYPDAPCLKKFYKIATRQYRALCGL